MVLLAAITAIAATGCGSATTSTPQPTTSTNPQAAQATQPAPTPSRSPTQSTAPVAPPSPISVPLVATAHWTSTGQGFRLHVRPSSAGRAHAAGHAARALTEALAAAGAQPLTLTSDSRRSLTNQLRCHAVFARLKPWWNLETWRPDVGFNATVLAACNP